MKKPNRKREANLMIKLTENEKAKIEAAALSEGLMMSSYARVILQAAVEKPLAEVVSAISKI